MKHLWIVALSLLLAGSGHASPVPAVSIGELIDTADVIVIGTLARGRADPMTATHGPLRVASVLKGPDDLQPQSVDVAWTIPPTLVHSGTQGLWFLTTTERPGMYRATGKTSLPALVVIGPARIERTLTMEEQVAQVLAHTIAAGNPAICRTTGSPTCSSTVAASRRQEALATLIRLPRALAAESLSLLVTHPAAEVRMLAVAGQLDVGSTTQVQAVFEQLMHPRADEWIAARVLAVAMARNAAAIGSSRHFRQMLGSSDPFIRTMALDGLQYTATTDDLAVLVELLDHPRFSTRSVAANTLLRLSGQPAMSVALYREQERAMRRRLRAWAADQPS